MNVSYQSSFNVYKKISDKSLIVSGKSSPHTEVSLPFNKRTNSNDQFDITLGNPSSRGQVWYTVEQIANKHRQITQNAIRAQIFAAKPRLRAKKKGGDDWIQGNGLAPALRKVGRRLLIDESLYSLWIDKGCCNNGVAK